MRMIMEMREESKSINKNIESTIQVYTVGKLSNFLTPFFSKGRGRKIGKMKRARIIERSIART